MGERMTTTKMTPWEMAVALSALAEQNGYYFDRIEFWSPHNGWEGRHVFTSPDWKAGSGSVAPGG